MGENKTENCINTKCCATTGYNCFQKKPGVAGCLKGCDPKKGGWDCTMPNEVLELVDVKEVPNTRFYQDQRRSWSCCSSSTARVLECFLALVLMCSRMLMSLWGEITRPSK